MNSAMKTARGPLLVVLLAALGINALSFTATNLWVTPTSMEYLELAADLLHGRGLSNELFLIRTPAYPMLLAAVFAVFDSWSPAVLSGLQHLMTAGVVFTTAATAWRVTGGRGLTLFVGLATALNLQIIAFAPQVMSETPFILGAACCLYFLVTFARTNRAGAIFWASTAAAIAYLFRPIGLTLTALCAFLVGWEMVRARRISLRPAVAVLLPSILFILPWMVHNQFVHGAQSFTRTLDFALYNRAVFVERPQESSGPALSELRGVVAEAKRAGKLDADADEGLAWTVWMAYRDVENASLKESSQKLGAAAWESLKRDPKKLAFDSVRYTAWMLLSPDSSYRYVPGGAPGVGGKRPRCAVVFDSGLYREPHAAVLATYSDFLPLSSEPKATTPIWEVMVRMYHRVFELGPAPRPVLDSLYEVTVAFCLLGLAASLFSTERRLWLIVAAVVGLQIVPSAFVAGVGPRYSVPIQPQLILFGAWFGAWIGVSCLAVFRRWTTPTEAPPARHKFALHSQGT